MTLPNADQAHVPDEKVVGYLLSEEHANGRSKARFFRSVGFTKAEAAALIAALLEVARTGSVTDRLQDEHGTRYVVDGSVETPTAHTIDIRTVWIVLEEEQRPRFVTAYPR